MRAGPIVKGHCEMMLVLSCLMLEELLVVGCRFLHEVSTSCKMFS